jgi:hypothetical protein
MSADTSCVPNLPPLSARPGLHGIPDEKLRQPSRLNPTEPPHAMRASAEAFMSANRISRALGRDSRPWRTAPFEHG